MTDYTKLTKEELIKKLEESDKKQEIAEKIRLSGVTKDSPLDEKIEAIVRSYGRFCIEENGFNKSMQMISYIKNGVSYQQIESIQSIVNKLLGF